MLKVRGEGVLITTEHAEEAVHCTAEDGVELAGLHIRPHSDRFPGTVILWLHDAGLTFAARTYVELGRDLAHRGCAFMSADTRGRDRLAVLHAADGLYTGGTHWERLDDAPLDIRAWIDATAARDYRRIVLAGHGVGAAKVVYYMARCEDARVAGLIAASPPVGVADAPERLAQARALVDAGRGDEPLPPREGAPPWAVVAARTIVTRDEVVQPAFTTERGEPWIAGVRCPILTFYGTSEEGTTEALETIKHNAVHAPCQTETIQNADHLYTGRGREVARTIVGWMRNAGVA